MSVIHQILSIVFYLSSLFETTFLCLLGTALSLLILYFVYVTCFWILMILLGKLPDGIYKISNDSILVVELPCVYTRTSWKGPSPRDLLCSFCRLQRLSEPHFAANMVMLDSDMRVKTDQSPHMDLKTSTKWTSH